MLQKSVLRLIFYSIVSIGITGNIADGKSAVARSDAAVPRVIPKPVAAPSRPPVHRALVGVASWYGPHFQGRLTADGERFDMRKLTAAHRTLPLGSEVRVTNLNNGRTVEVTINDRGPVPKGRMIDLSKRAAQVLGMTRQGLALVRVDPVPALYAYN